MQILLANPRGFCAGVDRAISIVENALAIYGAPIYVRHEVVHNRYVVDSLRERGAIFIEQISEVPDGAILIFSAHGVSQAVRNEAKSRDADHACGINIQPWHQILSDTVTTLLQTGVAGDTPVIAGQSL